MYYIVYVTGLAGFGKNVGQTQPQRNRIPNAMVTLRRAYQLKHVISVTDVRANRDMQKGDWSNDQASPTTMAAI